MTTIYFCGGIKDVSVKEASAWRDEAIKNLVAKFPNRFKCLNPMRRNFRGTEYQARNEMVPLDKVDILNSDILLVNGTKPSWGTAMEVIFAFENNKIVVAFTGAEVEMTSPWLAYHATKVCETMEDAIEYIVKQF